MNNDALRIAFIHPNLGIGGAERVVVDAALYFQGRAAVRSSPGITIKLLLRGDPRRHARVHLPVFIPTHVRPAAAPAARGAHGVSEGCLASKAPRRYFLRSYPALYRSPGFGGAKIWYTIIPTVIRMASIYLNNFFYQLYRRPIDQLGGRHRGGGPHSPTASLRRRLRRAYPSPVVQSKWSIRSIPRSTGARAPAGRKRRRRRGRVAVHNRFCPLGDIRLAVGAGARAGLPPEAAFRRVGWCAGG
jgi:hypothetical protein